MASHKERIQEQAFEGVYLGKFTESITPKVEQPKEGIWVNSFILSSGRQIRDLVTTTYYFFPGCKPQEEGRTVTQRERQGLPRGRAALNFSLCLVYMAWLNARLGKGQSLPWNHYPSSHFLALLGRSGFSMVISNCPSTGGSVI